MELYIPKIDELDYRKYILADPLSMSYNRGFNLDFPEYNNETGCIDFHEGKWENWYEYWINQEPTRFYAYLREEGKYVGEVALRLIESKEAHMISIIIDSRYRNKGYGTKGLKLLMKHAFYDLELSKVADDFPVGRVHSEKLFKSFGFEHVVEDNMNFFTLTRDRYNTLGRFRI